MAVTLSPIKISSLVSTQNLQLTVYLVKSIYTYLALAKLHNLNEKQSHTITHKN